MIKKILVAVSRCENNKSVFDSAVALAQNTGASIMLLHVLAEGEPGYPVLPTCTYYPVVDSHDYDRYQQQLAEYQRWGLDFLQCLCQEASAVGLNVEYTQLKGSPGRTICELASNWSADLIVVGSRGLKGLKEMFLGSVSNYVTHHAPCSVLIVRADLDTETKAAFSQAEADTQQELTLNQYLLFSNRKRGFPMLNKILVAIDSSQRNESVFYTAVFLARTTGASIMLLHILSEEDSDYPVLPTYTYYSILNDSDDGLYREKFAQYEQRRVDFRKNLTQKAIEAGVNVEYTQLTGSPGQTICELASNWSADLIVVGSRGLKGLKEMFLGSVSNYVTHHAPCSVLIVRPQLNTEADAAFSQK